LSSARSGAGHLGQVVDQGVPYSCASAAASRQAKGSSVLTWPAYEAGAGRFTTRKGWGLAFLKCRRQGLQPLPQLKNAACRSPARQLPAGAVRIHGSGQGQAGLKGRFMAGDLEQG
jgi:hypothetical protein